MTSPRTSSRTASPILRRLWFAAIPLALGIAASVISVALGERRVIVTSTFVSAIGLQLGIAAAAVIVAVVLVRHALARREQRGRAAVAEEAADRQRRLVDRLDHELKNPVTAIRAGLSNLTDAHGRAPEAVAAIDAQAERLGRVLGELRKLGELESVRLEIAPVDLGTVLDDVRDAVDELPETAERTVTIALPRAPRPLPSVPGDADLLFLAFYNVVANAIKYTSPGDRIEVRGGEDDRGVTIDIADTGPGIPIAEQDLVWEELARGSTTRHLPGSGLGLPLVRAIVARHGGAATLQSRPGEGTVVRVRLPLGG